VALILNLIRRITMGILSGNPTDEPLYYGEVFSTWSFLLTAKGGIGLLPTPPKRTKACLDDIPA
jgi:hypothetical protein